MDRATGNGCGIEGKALMRHMETFCREIGERHLGSDGERKAADYIQAQVEAAGWAVERQGFEAPGWRYGNFELRTEKGGRRFPCFPCFYSCGGAARGAPVFFEMDRPAPITAERFGGRIVVAHGVFDTVRTTNRMALEFDRAGAAALIVASPYQDTVSTKIVRQPGLDRLVVLTVSRNTALDLARAAKGEGLALSVEAENFTYEACNLVATFPGSKPGRATALISAHYDTAPGIEGAGDDASGMAILLELARTGAEAFRGAPAAVELAAFTGEEYGGTDGCGCGASHYARLRSPDSGTMAWMVSLDDVGTHLGRMRPVISEGAAIKPLLDAALAAWDLDAVEQPWPGCDVGPFNLRGIPTVFFSEAKPPNGVGHFPLHSPRDNLDLIDPDKLAANACAIRDCLLAMLKRPRDG